MLECRYDFLSVFFTGRREAGTQCFGMTFTPTIESRDG